jgi:hypothetical protein
MFLSSANALKKVNVRALTKLDSDLLDFANVNALNKQRATYKKKMAGA